MAHQDMKSQITAHFESSSGHFRFEQVYSCLNREQMPLWIACYSHFITSYLLEKLSEHDCPDPNVLTAIFNLYNGYLNEKVRKLPSQCKAFHTVLMPHFADSLRRPLVSVSDTVHINISRVIAMKEFKFLKAVVRYGVNCSNKTYQSESTVCNEILRTYLWRMARRPDPLYTLIGKHLEAFRESICDPGELDPEEIARIVRKSVRVRTVINVLCLLVESDPVLEMSVCDCLGLYYEATREPLVTVTEIQELLDIPEHSPPLFDENRIKESFDKLRTYFPDSDILQPRSLQHLCRCVVRDCLRHNGVLPLLVQELPVQSFLKDYILIVKAES